jgi:hypothetical protein
LKHLLTYEAINELREWLEDGVIPTVHGLRIKKFYENFELSDGRDSTIIYTPEQLIVVETEEMANDILAMEYQDLRKSIGKGIHAFYRAIQEDYANISREQVREFLKKQTGYQLRIQPKKVTNRTILAEYPTQKLEVDLVDLSRYEKRGYRYIANVIDMATRYLWSRAIKKKEAVVVRDVLKSIFEEDDFKPKVLISDNGGEFRAELDVYLKEQGVKHDFTKSYSPLGLIETVNQQIRRKISDAMVREQTDDWVKYVKVAQDSWNSSTHAGQKHTPEFLFLSQGDDVKEERGDALEKLKEQSRKRIAKNKSKELDVGNVVRVQMRAISTKVRKAVKEDKTRKWLPVQWSPELYVVKSIIKPDYNRPEGTSKLQYTIEKLDGSPITTERLVTDATTRVRKDAKFFASELQLVAKDTSSIPKGADAPKGLLNLNRVIGEARKPVTTGNKVVRAKPSQRTKAPTPQQPRRSTRERRKPTYLKDYTLTNP